MEYYRTFAPDKQKFVLKYPIPDLVRKCAGLVNQLPEDQQTMDKLNEIVNQRLSVMIQKHPNGSGSYQLKQRK